MIPQVDEARCVGDGACVASCPTRALALVGGRPWLPRLRDCVGCGACVEVCPTAAIQLVPAAGGWYDPGPKEEQA